MERFRRSMLFVPGGNDKVLAKGLGLDVDSLILDLEDSVAAEKKSDARKAVAEALKVNDFGRKEKVVRINSLKTEHGGPDIDVVISGRPDTLLVPKVGQAQDILDHDARITEAEKREGLPSGTIGLIALIESPMGIVHIDEIALASPRMSGLLFGAADFTRETRGQITPDRFELYYPMMRILLAARVAGIDAIDTPYFDIKDSVGLERHTRQAKDMGYDGKAIIHPGQIEIVNRCFTPTAQEVEFARRVITEFEKAKAEGRGAIQIDGKLIEILHVEMAHRVLKMMESLGKDS